MKSDLAVQSVLPSDREWLLHDVASSRQIEQYAIEVGPPRLLMQRAGLAVARLACAVLPSARSVWIAAGPGNNGGDGLVAARHLHLAGWSVRVTLLGAPGALPDDAAHAYAQARAANVPVQREIPALADVDMCIDAILGIGANRSPAGEIAGAIQALNAATAPVLAVDMPSGLAADNGQRLGGAAIRATHTLSLLTLKPGLFTAQGRDHAGRVWLDRLGQIDTAASATARLIGPPSTTPRAHILHKGNLGDVIVVGGATGMSGAALLAARAALASGAGRVYVARLDGALEPDPNRPELMPRATAEMLEADTLAHATVVCGCGGGDAVRATLPMLLHHAARLVLDADALNAIATDVTLRVLLRGRKARALPTIATPHPLEAARLLGVDAVEVQADRLVQARALAEDLQCTIVLKGSGTCVATPGALPAINPTGNARLASAGTGDVLAGWLGGSWAQAALRSSDAVAAEAVWLHGSAADHGDLATPLLAADLIAAMTAARARR